MKQPPLLGGFVIVAIASVLVTQPVPAQEKTFSESTISAIPQTSKKEQPLTEAKWLTQVSPPSEAGAEQIAQIIAVQLKPTDKGLEVILETAAEFPEVLTSSAENSLITDIPNAQLRLPKGGAFRQDNPTPDIALVEVTNLDAKSIRVKVTGKVGVPMAEVSQSPQALILSVAAPPALAPQPTPAPPAPPAEPVPPEPQQPQAPEAPAPEPQAEEERLELTVTAEEEAGGYQVPNASTATRTDTPILDIPASIQVVPRQVLEDQQVTRLDEALRNVSGVTVSGTTGNTSENFNIRGFDGAPVLQDGFRQFGGFGRNFSETTNLERVEVLKGPASILYGEIQPGGVINLVTKQPLAEPFYEAELQVGSRSLFRPQVDISGPLTSDGRVRYRLNALYGHEDSFRDFEQDFDRFFIAPVVSWQISDRTDLTVLLEYTDEESPLDDGLPASGDGVVDVPFDRIISEPDNVVNSQFTNVGYNLEHRFNDNWRLRNAFRYTNRNVLDIGAIPLDFDEDTGSVTRLLGRQDLDVQDYSLQTNVVGEFATGSIQHTFLFGVDLNRTEDREITDGDSNPPPFDIFNPVYGALANANPDDFPSLFNIEIQTDRLGVYLQDQIKLLDNLILLAGVRYDTVDSTTTNEPTDSDPTRSETNQSDNAWTPRVGVVYKPVDFLSLFASYSQSFTPSSDTTRSGTPLEPERGEGIEAGVKAELLDDNLFATLAYFDITRQNVATPDPTDPFASVATGEQRSRGVELDVIGEILPGWKVIASYAYIDAIVTEDNPARVGNHLFNTPENTTSLWTTYEIQEGNFQGLGFGLGFNFVGEREGDLDNSFGLDSYFLTNATIFYRRNNWRFALNAKNLFDIDYIAASNNRRSSGLEPGEPFTVLGSVSVEF